VCISSSFLALPKTKKNESQSPYLQFKVSKKIKLTLELLSCFIVSFFSKEIVFSKKKESVPRRVHA